MQTKRYITLYIVPASICFHALVTRDYQETAARSTECILCILNRPIWDGSFADPLLGVEALQVQEPEHEGWESRANTVPRCAHICTVGPTRMLTLFRSPALYSAPCAKVAAPKRWPLQLGRAIKSHAALRRPRPVSCAAKGIRSVSGSRLALPTIG